jgi:hypothetical protein
MDVSYTDAALDTWFSQWLAGFLGLVVDVTGLVLLVVVAVALGRLYSVPSARRQFWCRIAGREVEVDFETRGILRRPVNVIRCSAFEDGDGVACSRRCLDASFRAQWEPPLPVLTHANGARRPDD